MVIIIIIIIILFDVRKLERKNETGTSYQCQFHVRQCDPVQITRTASYSTVILQI